MKKLVIQIVVMIVAVIAASLISVHLMGMQAKISPEKADGAVNALSRTPLGGFHKFASDVEWMRLINYLGSLESINQNNVKDVASKLEKLISYDPNLEKAYKDGVLLMSIEDSGKTIEFLKKACQNPHFSNNWEIPFYAGYVMMHNAKPAQYEEASKFFAEAMKRSSSDERASYVVSSYFRAKAKAMAEPMVVAEFNKIVKDRAAKKMKAMTPDEERILRSELFSKFERETMLAVLFDYWKTMNSGVEGMSSENMNSNIDINNRLIKAIKDVIVPSEDYKQPTAKGAALAKKVIDTVFEKAHICSNCTAPHKQGDKFCSSCGKSVNVWGLCKAANCRKPLASENAAFCSSCGASQK